MHVDSTSAFDPNDYPIDDISKKKVGLIISGWNTEIIELLKSNCTIRLKQLGFDECNFLEFEVPGSFELPWGAKQLITKGGFDGIICFGCVVKGETQHNEYINHSVAKAIMGLNLTTNTPVLFGVLTTNTIEQAQARADGSKGNKGKECAEALVKMLSAKQNLNSHKSKISF